MTGRKVPGHLASPLEAGAREIDLVLSGLEDSMRIGYNQIREIRRARKNVPDYRTAAYVLALEKIADAYLEFGIGR